MREIMSAGKTLPEAYHRMLLDLQAQGELCKCTDWNTTQREISATMVVEEPLAEPMISRLFIGGVRELEQYRQEMLDGILDFEVERGKWNYTYHQRMGDQVDFVISELRRNPDSRRAVICIRTPEDMGSDDPACLQHLQYFVRNGRLDCKVLFRSNDACKATFMNAFALILLQKRIADSLGLEIGVYVHRANSMHCYERDFAMLDGYCARIRNADGDPDELCYEYEGEWKELMEDCQADIAAQVEQLKQQG